jgi:hypothetical protein
MPWPRLIASNSNKKISGLKKMGAFGAKKNVSRCQ